MSEQKILEDAVEETKKAYDLASENLRLYMITNSGFSMGDKVEYGYPRRRKMGIVVGFRSSWEGFKQIPIIAKLNKDGSTHATQRDRYPENPVKV